MENFPKKIVEEIDYSSKLVNLLANVAGTFGLFIEITLTTFVEIFWLFRVT